jgi:hypothetical protein
MIAKTSDQNADAAIQIERFEARPRATAVSASAFDFVNGSNSGLLTITSTDRHYRDNVANFSLEAMGAKCFLAHGSGNFFSIPIPNDGFLLDS